MTLAYTIENCRNCLTRHIKLSKIKYSDRVAETCEACDRGEPAGTPLFYIMEMVYMQKMLDFIT